jgi:hypothetical protein
MDLRYSCVALQSAWQESESKSKSGQNTQAHFPTARHVEPSREVNTMSTDMPMASRLCFYINLCPWNCQPSAHAMPTARQSSEVFKDQQQRVAMAASDSTAAASLLQGQNQFVLEVTFDSTLKRHRHQHNAAAKIHHEFAANEGHESAEVAH